MNNRTKTKENPSSELQILHEQYDTLKTTYDNSIVWQKQIEQELISTFEELSFETEEKGKRAAELIILNLKIKFEDAEKKQRAEELIIANIELVFQNKEKEKRAAELIIANKALAFQKNENEKLVAELIVANKELMFQNEEKAKRAAELVIANKALAFQQNEKAKRAAELVIANKELAFQNEEKTKRAKELKTANKNLVEETELFIRAEQQLKKSSQNWIYTFNAIRDGIALLDKDQKIMETNQAFLDIIGKTREEIIDQHCYSVVQGTECPINNCPVVRSQKSNKRETKELVINDSIYELLVDPILDQNNKFAGAVHILADITSRKEIEGAKQRNLDQLQYFHNITVGREIKMQELKKEINDILIRLGGTAKYDIFT